MMGDALQADVKRLVDLLHDEVEAAMLSAGQQPDATERRYFQGYGAVLEYSESQLRDFLTEPHLGVIEMLMVLPNTTAGKQDAQTKSGAEETPEARRYHFGRATAYQRLEEQLKTLVPRHITAPGTTAPRQPLQELGERDEAMQIVFGQEIEETGMDRQSVRARLRQFVIRATGFARPQTSAREP